MKVLSLYCGAAGIDEGLRQAGIKTTLAIDSDQLCIETVKLNHDCETIVGKVHENINSFGDFDIVVGGPPCPEFSRAKTERTFDDTEIKNFWDVIRLIKPKYWLMENVQDVIKVCTERNFLINCANYGTPQTRVRRFFTNLQKPKHTHSRTPSQDLFGNEIKKWVSVREALKLDGIIQNRTIHNWKKKQYKKTTESSSPTILCDKSSDGIWIQDRKTTFKDGFRNYSPNRPCFTLLADSRVYISPTGFKNKNKKLISRTINEPVQTVVNANEYQLTNNPVYSEKYKQFKNTSEEGYRLNNNEVAILQGFPKTYKFYGNKTTVRRQIGNALPPQPVKALFEQIKVVA